MDPKLSIDPAAALGYLRGLAGSESSGLPDDTNGISGLQPDLGPEVGGLAALLVRALRPRRILEIGTAAGVTATRLGGEARTYGGRLTTIEIRPDLAAMADERLRRAGLESVVEVIVADACSWSAEAMERMRQAAEIGVYGLIVQDGGKESYLELLPVLIQLLEEGGILLTDDVLFPVMNLPERLRPWQDAITSHNQALAARRDLMTVWLPIGDGVALSLKPRREEAGTTILE